MTMQTKKHLYVFFLIALWFPQGASAGLTTQAAREVAEQVVKKFGSKVGSETVETIAEKTVQLSAKYGDDAVSAVRKVGTKAFHLADEAGEHSGDALKLLSKYGDDAVLICQKPQRLKLFAQYGDDVAEAMLRHGDNAEVLVQQYGKSAAGALAKIESQNGRRLIQMSEGGELAKVGGADKVFAVVEKYGNKGAEFIWKNKAALAVVAAAAAFYSDPEPFINGMKELVIEGGGAVVTAAGKEIAQPTIDKMNSVVLTFLVVGLTVGFVALTFRRLLWKLILPKRKRLKH